MVTTWTINGPDSNPALLHALRAKSTSQSNILQCKRGESMVCTRGSIDGLDSQCTITTTVVTKLSGNKVTNLHSRQLKNCRYEWLQWYRRTGQMRVETNAKYTRLTKSVASTAITNRGHGGRVLAHTRISFRFIEHYYSTIR